MSGGVLVTGAGGYVARQLAPVLRALQPDARLVGVVRADAPARPDRWDEVLVADLRDRDAVERLIATARPAAVVHLAGRRTGSLPELLESNAGATGHLLTAIREAGAGVRTVVVGSSSELGASEPAGAPLGEDAVCQPIDGYGVAKLAQSALADATFQHYGQDVVRVRLFNLVGPDLPGELLPGRCARLLAALGASGAGGHLHFRGLDTARDYVDVRDACRAIALALAHAASGDLFHVGRGVAVTGREVVTQLIAIARPLTGPVTFDETVTAPATVPTQRADATRAARVLGWRPTVPLAQSLADLWHSVAGAPAPRSGA